MFGQAASPAGTGIRFPDWGKAELATAAVVASDAPNMSI